jgi:carboxymethylenebutenolidase
MKEWLKVIVVGGMIALVAFGAFLWASPPKSQMVEYKSGDDTVRAYLVLPDSPGPHPGIVVIHEYWGLNDWVKEQAQKLAAQGYEALAIDLYRGAVATDPEDAGELMRSLPHDRSTRDLEAAYDYLAARPEVDKNRIGSIGWCMGGGYSLQLAMHEPKLAACVVNYGAMPTDPADIAKIQAPILGNFGADDRGITPDAVHNFETAMKAAGKSVDLKIYDGAGHAFENPNNATGYRPEAAADAWNRIFAFFAKTLKP